MLPYNAENMTIEDLRELAAKYANAEHGRYADSADITSYANARERAEAKKKRRKS